MRTPLLLRVLPVLLLAGMLAPLPAPAADPENPFEHGRSAMRRGIAYLVANQRDDGAWSPDVGPAITALALRALLDDPQTPDEHPAVRKAFRYVLDRVRPDGGIHEGMLPNYNTAIALSAISRRPDRPGVREAMEGAVEFLRGLQWQEGMEDPQGQPITRSHPYYGGAGYGKHGRPDLSNTQIMLQGLYDAGVPADDPAFQRALVFVHRLQGVESNAMHGEKIVNDGGFIYATSINSDRIGVPESKASPEMIDEGKAGRAVSGLRTYGSITYAGFKSYVYANLTSEDPRVAAAIDWIRRNYTLEKNPGMPEALQNHGLYYYYLTFARALDAFGADTLTGAEGQVHPWREDLVRALAARQNEDGSWTNTASRWMERDPNLVTAYALIALQAAMDLEG